MQRRLDRKPEAMTVRRSTVEHVFGTLKHWMGYTHFLTRTLGRVSTEMSLQVIAKAGDESAILHLQLVLDLMISFTGRWC